MAPERVIAWAFAGIMLVVFLFVLLKLADSV
jgi:hypothetical protein